VADGADGAPGVSAIVAQDATRAMSARVREAAGRRELLRISGGGTWLDANRPVRASARLTTTQASGITEYVAGDLTITVGSGTTLAEIARVTGAAGQWLTLDPHGTDEGTIGATIATASAGPLSHHFGLARDVVLGLEFVTGEGRVVRGGGRVVKNVAGYDLARLLTGSWGTLGVITEITLRLRARPEVDRTVAVPFAGTSDDAQSLRRRLQELPATPFCAELVNAALAKSLGIGDDSLLLLRLGGNEPAVRAQHEAIAAFGDVAELSPNVWTALRAAEPDGASVIRLSQLPSRIGETWHVAGQLAEAWPGTLLHATMGRGVVRCMLPRGDESALRKALSLPFHGTRIAERLPERLWPVIAPASATDRLSLGIRRTFDPHGVLNPGILGSPES
jgi:glycolate oxidase FAD binding subunit